MAPRAGGEGAVSGVLAEVPVSRVYLAQGRAAVLPLVPPEGLSAEARATWRPAGPPRIVLENGTELSSEVWAITGAAPLDPLAPTRWLPPGLTWSASRLSEVRPDFAAASATPVRWVALVEAPTGIPERRLPTFARVDDRVVELGWLPPARLNPDVARAAKPQVSAPSVRALGELLRSDAADPQRRWRVRLIAERFTDRALWGDDAPPGFGAAESDLAPPLEATAQQLELNARSALDNLRRFDAPLALEVLNRMTAVVRSPEGVLLPAWPAGNEGVGPLLETLLAPLAVGGMGGAVDAGAVRTEAARRWLAETPRALAWIIDDIGARTPTRFEPSVGVADLTGAGGRAWATSSLAYSGQELEVALQPAHAAALRMLMPLPERSLAGPRGVEPAPVIEAGLDQSSGTTDPAERSADAALNPIHGVVPVRPPGFVLGPLLEPWTMASWRSRRPVPTGTVRGGTVTIQRAVAAMGDPSQPLEWEAVLRCGPAARGTDQGDTVRLWCGPFSKPRGIIEVRPGRGAEWTRGPDQRGTRLTWRAIEPAPGEPEGSWAMIVTIPREAFEDDGVLIVGLERESPAGARTAFPRPMMPGQSEPGRVALDPSAWGGLGAAGR